MTKEEKRIVLKTMDLLYAYLDGEVSNEDAETMKEILFNEFFEYGNGNRDNLFEHIKKRW